MNNKEKEQIIKLYYSGKNCKEISLIVNIDSKYINKFLRKNNLSTNQSIYNKLTSFEVEDIRSLYIKGYTARLILDKYKNKVKCENTIIKIIKDGNIKIREAKRFTKIENEDFFEKIDTEEKAYILGFLIADGYIIYPNRKNRTPLWGITLKNEDSYMLEKIASIIGTNKKIIYNKKRNESILTITSNKMVKDLEKYGIVKRKTNTIKIPEIENKLYRHLIRGIFDGDGCISDYKCTFYGNRFIVPTIQEILLENICINKTKIFRKKSKINETNDLYSFTFSSKKDVKSFYIYLYKNSNIYLNRKFLRFKKLEIIQSLL